MILQFIFCIFLLQYNTFDMKFLSVIAFTAVLGLSTSQLAQIKGQNVAPFPQKQVPIQNPFHPTKSTSIPFNVRRQDIEESYSESTSQKQGFWSHQFPQRPQFNSKKDIEHFQKHKEKAKDSRHWDQYQGQGRHHQQKDGRFRHILFSVLFFGFFATILCCLIKRCRRKRNCRGGMKQWAMSDNFIEKQINLHLQQIRRLEDIKLRRRAPIPIYPNNYVQQERISYGEPRNMNRQFQHQVPTGRPMNQFENDYQY